MRFSKNQKLKYISVIPLLALLIFFTSLKAFSQERHAVKDDFSNLPTFILSKLSGSDSYQAVRHLSFGRYAVAKNGFWGFLDEKGDEIIATKYDRVYNFISSLTGVLKNGKWYLIDTVGNVVGNINGYDHIGPFQNKRFRVFVNGRYKYLDETGNEVLSISSIDSSNSNEYINHSLTSRNVGCPDNIDFEFLDFTNWQCDTGQVVGPTNSVWGVSPDGTNRIINATVTPPLPLRHEIIINNSNNPVDPYGGFPVNSPDGSGAFVKLGSDQPGGNDPVNGLPWANAKSESVTYNLNIPSSTTNLSFVYNFAVVLVEPLAPSPVHDYDDKPRFKVEILDAVTNQVLNCGKVEYVADPISVGAGGFDTSQVNAIGGRVWFKNWSKRFINLYPYRGKSIKIKFSMVDCTLGGHWGYAYLDIQGCQNFATASVTCSRPARTIMSGPPLFDTYQWYNKNFTVQYGSGMNLVYNDSLTVGDTINLIATPPPILFNTQVCPDTIRVVVSASNGSIVYDAGPDKNLCNGRSISIGSPVFNSNYRFIWTPAPGLSNLNSSLVFVNPSSDITYFVTVTDSATLCSTQDSVRIRVEPSPNLRVQVANPCFNQIATVTASGGDSYTWATSPNRLPTSYTLNNGNPSFASFITSRTSDTLNISAGINASTCRADTTIIVNANPIPIVDFFVPQPQCVNGNEFYLTTGAFVNPGSISNNQWSINGSPLTAGNDSGIIFSLPQIVGSYPVKLVSTTNMGCKDSVTHLLDIKADPKAVFNPSGPRGCLSNNNFTFTDSSYIAGDSIVDYLWDFGDGQSSVVRSPSHIYTATGTFNVQLIVTSNFGCTDTTLRTIEINKNPIAYFAQPDSQCLEGNRFQFASQSTISPPQTITSQKWHLNGNIFSGNNLNYSFPSSGTYPVKLVVTSSKGCEDSITQVLMVFPKPNAAFPLPNTICFDNNLIQFRSTSLVSPGFIDSCFWDFGDGNQAISHSIRHSYTNSSLLNYQISLIVQSDRGCRDTTFNSFSFIESPSVTASVMSANKFCTGDSVRLQATASTPSGTPLTYQWQMGGVDIPSATNTSLTVRTSGIYTIVVKNVVGCTATSANDTVQVYPLPVGSIQQPNNNYICEGGSKLLTCNSNANRYQWYLNGIAIPGAVGPTYLATIPGIYTIELFSDFGCKNSAAGSITLSILNIPNPSFEAPEYCVLYPVVFRNTSDVSNSGPVLWTWDFGDGGTSSQVNPTHLYSDTGSYSVRLSVSSVICPSLISDSLIFVKVLNPIPGIRYNNVNAVPNTDQSLNSRDFGEGILWQPGTGLNNPSIYNPIFNYDRQQEYFVRIRNVSGCLTVDTQLVRVLREPDIKVPTAFSPNGDGHNDLLEIFLVGIHKFKRFMVFNRWGQLMFQTTDPRQLWDGKFQGRIQPVETYVWLAEGEDVDGIGVFKRGQTILLR